MRLITVYEIILLLPTGMWIIENVIGDRLSPFKLKIIIVIVKNYNSVNVSPAQSAADRQRYCGNHVVASSCFEWIGGKSQLNHANLYISNHI